MRALDEIKEISRHKRRQNRMTLIDRRRFNETSACRRICQASRALVRSAFRNWFNEIERGKPSLEVAAQGRLAGCWVTETIADVGRFAYLAGGSDGVREKIKPPAALLPRSTDARRDPQAHRP